MKASEDVTRYFEPDLFFPQVLSFSSISALMYTGCKWEWRRRRKRWSSLWLWPLSDFTWPALINSALGLGTKVRLGRPGLGFLVNWWRLRLVNNGIRAIPFWQLLHGLHNYLWTGWEICWWDLWVWFAFLLWCNLTFHQITSCTSQWKLWKWSQQICFTISSFC